MDLICGHVSPSHYVRGEWPLVDTSVMHLWCGVAETGVGECETETERVIRMS